MVDVGCNVLFFFLKKRPFKILNAGQDHIFNASKKRFSHTFLKLSFLIRSFETSKSRLSAVFVLSNLLVVATGLTGSEQCDQTIRLFVQYLAIYNNENLALKCKYIPK